MRLRAVLWDADGVLQRVPHGGEESMRAAVEGRVDDVDGFLAEAIAAERPALTGEVRWLDVLPGLLRRWGIEAAYDEVVAVWLSVEPVPVARDLARAVRATGVRCLLASNQDAHRARHLHEHLGYADLLDGEVYSCELGVAKPDPAYFTAVLNRLAWPPARCSSWTTSPPTSRRLGRWGCAPRCGPTASRSRCWPRTWSGTAP